MRPYQRRERIRRLRCRLLLSVRFAGRGPGQTGALEPLLIASGSPHPGYAHDDTRTHVDDASRRLLAKLTGSTVTSRDVPRLTASNVLSWSFAASDGTSGSSSARPPGKCFAERFSERRQPECGDGYERDRRRFAPGRISSSGRTAHTAGPNVARSPLSAATGIPIRVAAAGSIRRRSGFSRRSSIAAGWCFRPERLRSLARAPEPPVWAMTIDELCRLRLAGLRGGGSKTKLRSA